ncbi:MAG: DUF99 family protein [Desulfurococcales archaeon]|nr:DUF99 family protein [Desulfurococcales archaeon]
MIACDDGVVKKLGEGVTIATCLSWSSEDGLEDLAFLPVHVDGLDASAILSYLVTVVSPGRMADAILLDSLTIAGFNVVSPDTLYRARRVPVVVVYTYRPSYRRLSRGLEASGLPLRSVRSRILRLVDDYTRICTPLGELFIVAWRASIEDARRIVVEAQGRDRKPIPLRLAHYISSALSRIIYD